MSGGARRHRSRVRLAADHPGGDDREGTGPRTARPGRRAGAATGRHVLRLVALATAVLAASCTASPAAEPAVADACAGRGFAALAAWEAAGLSGAVAVHRDGEVVCSRGLGLADADAARPNRPDTVFSIGSITKAVTAAAVLKLVDEGRLALDDRVGAWLSPARGALAEATVFDLLLHRSGLGTRHGSDSVALPRADALAAIVGQRLAFAPGSGFAYSNSGYTLLAMIVEEASGTGFRSYVADRILTVDGTRLGGWWNGEPAPTGPRAVGRLPDGTAGQLGDLAGPHWALEGNGGIAMTADELARWVTALGEGSIVSDASLALMRQTAVDHGDGTGESVGWVTLDESVVGVEALASSGGGGDVGHEVAVVWVPAARLVVVAMANTPDVAPSEVIRVAVPAVAEDRPLPGPVEYVDLEPARLASLAGTYRLGDDDRFEVSTTDTGLRVTAIGRRAADALFRPGTPLVAEAIDRHERLASSFWRGETEPGRRELAALTSEYGQLERWEIVGSTFVRGEVRTFARLVFADRTVIEWIALDDAGGLAAADTADGYPALDAGALSTTRFAPRALDGLVADVRLRFTGDAVEIVHDGAVVARGVRPARGTPTR